MNEAFTLDPQLPERWGIALATARSALDAVDRARPPLFDTAPFRMNLRAQQCWFDSWCRVLGFGKPAPAARDHRRQIQQAHR